MIINIISYLKLMLKINTYKVQIYLKTINDNFQIIERFMIEQNPRKALIKEFGERVIFFKMVKIN